MTLQEAQTFFENLKAETTRKSKIKVYTKLVQILSKLKNRTLSKDEIHSIETELDRLHLNSNPENRKKHTRRALNKFEKYLADTLSLTSEGYYITVGIGLGSSFGALLGVLIGERIDEGSLGIALGIAFGMLIGMLVGRSMDAKAKNENRML